MDSKLKGGGVRMVFAGPNEVLWTCLRDGYVAIRFAKSREKWSKAVRSTIQHPRSPYHFRVSLAVAQAKELCRWKISGRAGSNQVAAHKGCLEA